ncbi:hypothetical protein BGW80DRAFT_1250491 [Lactifluus volemus]|nr:hypothetical protein BGW80DRAFT_1250491 [Lactifluus volemus]
MTMVPFYANYIPCSFQPSLRLPIRVLRPSDVVPPLAHARIGPIANLRHVASYDNVLKYCEVDAVFVIYAALDQDSRICRTSGGLETFNSMVPRTSSDHSLSMKYISAVHPTILRQKSAWYNWLLSYCTESPNLRSVNERKFRQAALRYPAASPILRGPFIFLGGFSSGQKTPLGAINAVAPSMKFMRHTCFALLEANAPSSGKYRGDPAQTIHRTIVGSRDTPYLQLLL